MKSVFIKMGQPVTTWLWFMSLACCWVPASFSHIQLIPLLNEFMLRETFGNLVSVGKFQGAIIMNKELEFSLAAVSLSSSKLRFL